MKKILFLFIISAYFTALNAQTNVFIPEPGEGFSFNTSSLIVGGTPGDYRASWRANSQEIQLLRENSIGLSHFSVAYGLGYSGHFYHSNLHIDVSASGEQTLVNLNGQEFIANRLATEYVDGILELRYRSKSNRRGRYTRIYIGGVVGYLTDSYSHLESASYRVKFYNIGGFSTLRYGAYLKAGRGPINLYYYYSLNPIVTSGVLVPELGAATSQNIGLAITL